MLTQPGAVVAHDDEGRGVGQPGAVEGVQQLPQTVIHPGELGSVECRYYGNRLWWIVERVGVNEEPGIEASIGVRARVETFNEFGRSIPGLVGIEAVDPEEEVVSMGIVAEALRRCVEESSSIPIVQTVSAVIRPRVGVDMGALCRVFTQEIEERVELPVVGPDGVAHPCPVDFAAADKGPGVERPVEVVAAVDQVGSVVNKLGGVARFFESVDDGPGVVRERLPNYGRGCPTSRS